MADLRSLVSMYEDARAKKEELEATLKEANKALQEAETALSDEMLEEDTPSITIGEYTYSFKNETKYNFVSAEKLAEMGADKFQVLRDNGFGFLITERVDSRTLSSTMKEVAESDEGIPEEIDSILSKFEVQGVGRRKATAKAMAKARKKEES